VQLPFEIEDLSATLAPETPICKKGRMLFNRQPYKRVIFIAGMNGTHLGGGTSVRLAVYGNR
jgi:hypothetical protein